MSNIDMRVLVNMVTKPEDKIQLISEERIKFVINGLEEKLRKEKPNCRVYHIILTIRYNELRIMSLEERDIIREVYMQAGWKNVEFNHYINDQLIFELKLKRHD